MISTTLHRILLLSVLCGLVIAQPCLAAKRVYISGRIKNAYGVPMSGIAVTATNGGGTGITNARGVYRLGVPTGWSGQIIPEHKEYIFEPAARSYDHIVDSMPNQDFITHAHWVMISGKVLGEDGRGVPNVAVVTRGSAQRSTVGRFDTLTLEDGSYTLRVPGDWTGTVSAIHPQFSFTPAEVSLEKLTDHRQKVNFRAGELRGAVISGVVTNYQGEPARNVPLTFTGTDASAGTDFTVQTAPDGSYAQFVPEGWSGRISTDPNYRLDPPTRTYKDVRSPQKDQNYRVFRNYYVSPEGTRGNTGTIARPLGSIQLGIRLLKPGDTLYLREGTYTESVEFAAAGLPDAYVTLKAYPGEKAVITYPRRRSAVRIGGYTKDRSAPKGRRFTPDGPYGRYIRIEDITFRDIHAGWQGALWMGMADHIVITRCTFESCGDHAIASEASTDVEISYCRILNTNGEKSDAIILGNIEDAIGGWPGYDFMNPEGGVPDPDKGSKRFKIHHNYIDGAPEMGFDILWFANDNEIYNNIVVNTSGGLSLKRFPSGNRVYNNIFVTRYAAFEIYKDASNNIIRNNIFVSREWCASRQQLGAGDRPMGPGNIIDYNLYWSPDPNLPMIVTGATATSLGRWTAQDINSGAYFRATGFEEHGIARDPGFMDLAALNFLPKPGSPSIDTGDPSVSSVVTDDLRGVPRPQGKGYDRGAYEWTPNPPPATATAPTE